MKFAIVFSIVLILSTFLGASSTTNMPSQISIDAYNQFESLASSTRPTILGPILFDDKHEERVAIPFNRTAKALNAVITPIEILEDSRCSKKVECIQEGTVKARIKVSSQLAESIQDIELGRDVITETETIHLVEVLPTKDYNGRVRPEQYIFVFKVSKR